MGGAVVSRLVVLGCGTLYPAYASYKAVKSANVRQYVRWMMYWIIFAIFITVETFTDILFSWVPFYYEVKVGFVIWLLSPYTKGAAFLYRKFVHPFLSKKEPEIDNFLMSAKEKSYATVLNYGSRGINVATTAFVTAAVRGQAAMSERLKSFSVNDISRLSDDTPVHSMNPMSYNPQVQREMLRQSPNVRPFDGPTSRRPLQADRQNSEQDVDTESFEMIDPEAPPGGLTMQRMTPVRDDYSPTTQFASSAAGGDNANQFIGGQYKAYSMMNLSHNVEPEETKPMIMTRTIQFTSTPPEVSVDDSMIPNETEHFARGATSYSTLPRQRKKKSKKDQEALTMISSSSSTSPSSSLRRSKRHTKPPSYLENSDDEHERY